MADDRGERTEQPTAKRLSEARERGQIARSPEISTAMMVLAVAAFLSWAGPSWVAGLNDLLPSMVPDLDPTPWTPARADEFARQTLARFLALVMPPVLTVVACVIGVNILQTGFNLSPKALAPKWDTLNPINGLRNLLGQQALVTLAKAPLKLALLGGVAWITVRPQISSLLAVGGRDAISGVRIFSDLALTLLWRLGAAHAVLAVLDYLYQRWSVRQSLRMTREEVKDEARQAEGDPQIRARFRSLHRQYAMRRMMQDVATADVVVTNPTRLAVALRYDAATMRAPKVIAKGARLIAARIRERAGEHGIPVVEHKPLAQALYKAVPVGGEIPSALYRAVAEILAYVWALGRRLPGMTR